MSNFKKLFVIILVAVLCIGISATTSKYILGTSQEENKVRPNTDANVNKPVVAVEPVSLNSVYSVNDAYGFYDEKDSDLQYLQDEYIVSKSVSSSLYGYTAIAPACNFYCYDYDSSRPIDATEGIIIDFTLAVGSTGYWPNMSIYPFFRAMTPIGEDVWNYFPAVTIKDVDYTYKQEMVASLATGESITIQDNSVRLTYIIRGYNEHSDMDSIYGELYIDGELVYGGWKTNYYLYMDVFSSCSPRYSDLRICNISPNNYYADYSSFKVLDYTFLSYGDIDFTECFDENGNLVYRPTSLNDEFIEAFINNRDVIDNILDR